MSTYKQLPFFSENPSENIIIDANDPKRKEKLYKKFADIINYSFD